MSIEDARRDEEQDPEIRLDEMRERAREGANDLIPILIEKAINGKTKDAIHVFEALANRSGFTEPEKNNNSQGPLINLNINATDLSNMLSGLKTITQAQGSRSAPSASQIGPNVQNESPKELEE